MTPEDQRYSRYLTTRATTIELPPGDPTSLVARAAVRRRRRRTVGSGLAALALVAGAVSVQQIDGGEDGGSSVASEANAVTAAAPLTWTTVVPNVGLTWSDSTATTEDGTQFGLSTAPGRYDPAASTGRRTLYRSGDGVEWSAIALPDDLWPSQIASSGNDLYAVGTSPAAGGGRALVLAKSAAGADWATTSLPLDLAALDAQYPQLNVSGIDVTVGAAGVVAAVQLRAYPDAAEFLPDDVPHFGWSWTTTGLDVYGAPEGCTLGELGEVVCGDEPIRKPQATEQVIASYTFAELGIDDALRSLIVGELHVFTSSNGEAFDEVSLPAGVSGSSSLVSTDDGYVLFATTWSGSSSIVTALRSSDARSWVVDDAAAVQGWPVATGTLGGRAAVIAQSESSGAVLKLQQVDGTWSTLDLGAAVTELVPTAGPFISATAADIGPLGAAAVISAYDEGTEVPQHFAVYSPDGKSISIQPLADLPDVPQGYAAAVRVSADAVTIVFGDANYEDGIPHSTLLVGTPR